MLALLPAPRAAALTEGPVTIDLDSTDVEVSAAARSAACPITTRASGWYVAPDSVPHCSSRAYLGIVADAAAGIGPHGSGTPSRH